VGVRPSPPSGGLSLVEDPPLAVAERHRQASSSSSFGCRREQTCYAVAKVVDRFERVCVKVNGESYHNKVDDRL